LLGDVNAVKKGKVGKRIARRAAGKVTPGNVGPSTMKTWPILVFMVLWLAGCAPPTSSVVRVVDGDTLRVLYKGRDEAVRLLRVDTPERGEVGFHEAAEALRKHVEGGKVVLVFEDPEVVARDRYGRLLAYLLVDGKNVNVELVREGWTPFWTRYGEGRLADAFRKAEAEARAAGRGLWAKEAP
jgi:micrococcal nuclease